MPQENKVVHLKPSPEKSSEFKLPEGFSVLPEYENESPLKQVFKYNGNLNTREARDALLEAGLDVDAKGAGVRFGDKRHSSQTTYHLIDEHPYSKNML